MRPIVIFAYAIVFWVTPARSNDGDDCFAKRGDGAMASCNRVIDSTKTSRADLATALINRGQQFYERQEYDRALEDFSASIALMPNAYPLAYADRGNCYFAKGDDLKAIENYSKAIELFATPHPASHTARGMLYQKAGQLKKARADYEAAIAAKSKYSDDQWAHDTARERLKAMKAD